MKLTADESRALGFIALLIVLSIGARLLDRPAPIQLDAEGVDVAALEAASREALERGRKPARRALRADERIDPNTASPEELQRLPRLTPAIADRIVEDRDRNGPYRAIQDLRRVRGVGPVTLEGWLPHLSLPAAHAAGAGARSPVSETSGSAAVPARAPARGEAIALNGATAAELERLPGIGAVLAARIVAYRDSVGGFRSIEELERVRGIGPAMMARLKPMLRLGT